MQHEQDRNAEELAAAKDAAAKAAEALAAAEARAAEVETRAKSEAVKMAARTMDNNAALVEANPLVTTTPGPTSAAAKMVSAADQKQIGLLLRQVFELQQELTIRLAEQIPRL